MEQFLQWLFDTYSISEDDLCEAMTDYAEWFDLTAESNIHDVLFYPDGYPVLAGDITRVYEDMIGYDADEFDSEGE